VPVWFVAQGSCLYVVTDPRSAKVSNLRQLNLVAAALEGGDRPVILQGTAQILERPWPREVVKQFRRKYDWEVEADRDYSCMLEIRPARWLEW
jgi:hypothetical protein